MMKKLNKLKDHKGCQREGARRERKSLKRVGGTSEDLGWRQRRGGPLPLKRKKDPVGKTMAI